MVDFRYHLVSIVAVFLALAVGIVVGTTALNGPVLDDLNARVQGLTDDKRTLEEDVRTAQGQVEAQQAAVADVAPVVVPGRLARQRVLLVSGPDAPAQAREDLVPLLTAAGAEVTGQVRLQPALLDPASGALLTDLVAAAAVAGEPAPEGEPVDQAAQQLASVLVREPGTEGGQPAAEVERVLAAYAGEDLLEVDGAVSQPATAVVVLVGAPPASTEGEEAEAAAVRTRALLGLARALDARSGGAVVAGPVDAGAEGGVLQALRDDAGAAEDVASVSGVETPIGRLATVLALAEQIAGGSGAYGTGPGAEVPLPELAAAPTGG